MASTTRESWLASAQTFEADWWRTHWNDGRDPVPESRAIMERLGYGQDSFAGLRVLDVGCGPTRRLAWLRGMAQLDAIEPLAVKYDSLGDGTALSDYREVYAVPAEVAVPGLRNKYDFAFAINSLDHCYDLGASLDAIRSYLVLGGRAMLSMDCDKWVDADETHPVCVTGAQFLAAISAAGFSVLREMTGDCPAGRFDAVIDPHSWGGGMAYHFEVQA